VAKGLEIPAVVGIGEFLSVTPVRIVSSMGSRTIDHRPTEEVLEQYRHGPITPLARRKTRNKASAGRNERPERGFPSTRNIEFPHETAACLHRAMDRVCTDRVLLTCRPRKEPSEKKDHYQAYAEFIRQMGRAPS